MSSRSAPKNRAASAYRCNKLRGLTVKAGAGRRLALRAVDADFIAVTQAAGLRQRREGLAYRLRIAPPGLPLRKRVAPGGQGLPVRRKLIYRTRRWISASSHRVFLAARLFRWPGLYLNWARFTLGFYGAVAYLRGPLGSLTDRLRGGERDG